LAYRLGGALLVGYGKLGEGQAEKYSDAGLFDFAVIIRKREK